MKRKQAIDWGGFAVPKQKKVVKKGKEYTAFIEAVFARDNYECRNPDCPSKKEPMPFPNSVLSVHHKQKRSHGRLDTMENCVTLCMYCHGLVEQYKLVVGEWGDN
jgi:5-methylcytosine-specific restriction endonuclease McrA